MKYTISLILFFITIYVFAQEEVSITSNDLELYGTLLQPNQDVNEVVLIISGSGETDRDGNTIKLGYTNDCLKMLAEQLAQKNIASLRYDKRGVGKSIHESLKTENLRFSQYIQDAENWIKFLQKKYKTVIVVGHSQGGLVGMIAAKNVGADKFISIAGLTQDAYQTIKRQLSSQSQFVTDAAYPILDNLYKGMKTDSVPTFLKTLFDPKIQDYFISFMQFDPVKEIKALNIPIQIIQGTTDLQITVEGATQLAKQNEKAQLMIIEGMNHVLKNSPKDTYENVTTYSNPDLPLHEDLVDSILHFIQ